MKKNLFRNAALTLAGAVSLAAPCLGQQVVGVPAPDINSLQAAQTSAADYFAAMKRQKELNTRLIDAVDTNSSPDNPAEKQSSQAATLELIKEGADINAPADPNGSTPLIQAALGNNMDMVRLLLAHGANVNGTDRDGFTPLMQAAGNANLDMVAFFLRKGADAKAQDESKMTALDHAAWITNQSAPAVIKLLLAYGADITAQDAYGVSPLGRATQTGNVASINTLLDAGADIESPMPHWTRSAYLQTHSYLPSEDINMFEGDTILMEAIATQKFDVVNALVQHGANVNAKDAAGRTPLMTMIVLLRNPPINDPALASLLIDHGADVNATYKGRTALAWAEKLGGRDAVVKVLRERGAKE